MQASLIMMQFNFFLQTCKQGDVGMQSGDQSFLSALCELIKQCLNGHSLSGDRNIIIMDRKYHVNES